MERLLKLLDENPNLAKEINKYIFIQKFITKKYTNYKPDMNNRVVTNPEFNNFFQSIYHAGTSEQFVKYSHLEESLALTTFHYMFDLLKKGIYVSIKGGCIDVFLPFSKFDYRNDWGQNLRTHTGNSRDVVVLAEKNHYTNKFDDTKYNTMIDRNTNHWYANYAIFRNEIYKNGNLRFKVDEGDKSVVNFLELISEVCYSRNIPDVHFFISPRDFPIVKKDMYHPYDRLYKGTNVPYLGKKYPLDLTKVPIFSQSITNEYADILIPNDDDIVEILKKEDRTIGFEHDWTRKKSIALFRGSATGCGTLPSNNPRLKLIEIAENNKQFIDAKLTGLNRKLKVDEKGYTVMIDQKKYPIMNKEYREKYYMSHSKQSEYKYIIHVQGHVAAFRLTRELSYKSLIIKVDSEYSTWYSNKLTGYRPGDDPEGVLVTAHYVRVKHDLSNLIDVIKWCILNDSMCRNIAERGYKFWKTHLETPTYMINYMEQILRQYSVSQIVKKRKGLIIIPYRDTPDGKRHEQLIVISEFFEKSLDKSMLSYTVAEQNDTKPFNRGWLLNKAVSQNMDYDYYIFHDVDLIPDSTLLKEYYKFPELPIHLGHRGQRWSVDKPVSWPVNKFIGGVFSVSKDDFIKINGFPNNFWGWGAEDDALSYRLYINDITVESPEKGSVTDLENLNIQEKLEVLRKNKEKNMTAWEQLDIDKKNWKKNGLNEFNLKI